MAKLVDVGDVAPDFVLPCTAGRSWSLSEARANSAVLIVFYSFDFAAPSVALLSEVAARSGELAELGVTVVGISVDSVFSHDAFAERLQLPFPLASDFNRKVCADYGVLANRLAGFKYVSKSGLFLIDRD